MRDQRRESGAPVEPYFDRTPQPFGDGPPDPMVYDTSPRMLRQRTLNFAAKRLVDMRYVSGLDRVTRRFGVAPPAQNHKVIGIDDKASAETSLKAELLPPQHKPAHVDVRQ